MKKLTRDARPAPRAAPFIIGVDESGTGAWSGPFTVCAYMSRAQDTPFITSVGADDSKKLTPITRRRICDHLAAACVIGQIIEVSHEYVDQKKAWREGVAQAIKYCLEYVNYDVTRVEVMIDGDVDHTLLGYFERIWSLTPKFLIKGDSLIPQISAASIFAKTRRTEIMQELHKQYPHYGWAGGAEGEGNQGYGTAAHLAAIQSHGVCALHRRIRPLIPYFDGKAVQGASALKEAPLHI